MSEDKADYGGVPPKPKKNRVRPTSAEHSAVVNRLTTERDGALALAREAQAGRVLAMRGEASALRLFTPRYFAVVFLLGVVVGGFIDRVVIALGGTLP